MAEEFEIGQVCEKISGKEKGSICVVIGKTEKNLVLIDGNVKRRKCNISHLKPLEKTIKIKEDEKTDKVREALKEAGFDLVKKIKLKEKLRVKREAKKEARENEKAKEVKEASAKKTGKKK